MPVRSLAAPLLIVVAMGLAATASDQVITFPGPAQDAGETGQPKQPRLEVATFGGGCFWCTEAVCEQIPGVRSVVSGYAGGNVPFPTYAAVSTGATGHAEVVQVVFDPAVLSYEKLLELFWRTHDPSTPNSQGPDVGTQYRSIILYHNEAQKKAAQKVYRDLKARRVLKEPVVTQLVPFTGFFPAEPYHQDYYSNHPFDTYTMVYIAPKIDEVISLQRRALRGSSRHRSGSSSPAHGHPGILIGDIAPR